MASHPPGGTQRRALRHRVGGGRGRGCRLKSRIDPRLVGCLHEADLLRCYIEEADRVRREELGEVGLFTDLAGRE
jgi:hypothetical protein